MEEQSGIDICTYAIHFPASANPVRLLPDILTFVTDLSKSYIWHKEAFNLSLSPIPFASTSAPTIQFLQGKVNCTDCVDDEWFVVWLLQQISIEWSTAVISIEDEDGEFMLIEAAEVLPKWVTPSNATNRVWVHQSRLHLVPLEHLSPISSTTSSTFEPPEEGFIDRAEAILLVRDVNIHTVAASDMEQIVWSRIEGYPAKIDEHHHKSLTYLPVEIALALQHDPTLIAPAIAAFYEREPVSLRACNTMTRFPPSSPANSFSTVIVEQTMDASPLDSLPKTVFTPILLTRPLYSQLVLQRFFSPKVFDKVGWMEGEKGGAEERRRSVGMKIACGFEMLYKLTAPLLRVATDFDASDPAFLKFLDRLSNKEFFEGEIRGSAKWNEKESIARRGYAASRNNDSNPSFAQRVDEAIAKSLGLDSPLANRIVSPLSLAAATKLESSEDWLSLDEQGFEEMLQSRGPGEDGLEDLEGFEPGEGYEDEMEGVEKENETEEGRMARMMAAELQGMAGKVEDFVHGRGAVDGAQFEDELSDDSDDDEEFVLSPEERAARTAALVDGIDPETWGHKATATSATPSTLPPRKAKLTSEKYDGASSDSSPSSDEEDGGIDGIGNRMDQDREDEVIGDSAGVADLEDEDAPAVLGEEEELDMGEEMDEFLKFATETLGLTEEQYKNILTERSGRGAFVPPPPQPKKTNQGPPASSASPSTAEAKAKPKAKEPLPRPPLKNPNLTDFDALMSQMDSELAKTRASTSNTTKSKPTAPKIPKLNPRGKPSAVVESDSEPSDESDGEMDAELACLFKTVGGDGEGTMDYNLVKNFLESFQSQGGFGGPASNLSGRLGFSMPREAAEK